MNCFIEEVKSHPSGERFKIVTTNLQNIEVQERLGTTVQDVLRETLQIKDVRTIDPKNPK